MLSLILLQFCEGFMVRNTRLIYLPNPIIPPLNDALLKFSLSLVAAELVKPLFILLARGLVP